jgi:hypothetical protein
MMGPPHAVTLTPGNTSVWPGSESPSERRVTKSSLCALEKHAMPIRKSTGTGTRFPGKSRLRPTHPEVGPFAGQKTRPLAAGCGLATPAWSGDGFRRGPLLKGDPRDGKSLEIPATAARSAGLNRRRKRHC